MQCLSNAMKYPRKIRQHLVIPEAQNHEFLFAKPRITHCVPVRLHGVLAAIDFDDESRLGTKKIHDVGADRSLSPKRKTLKTMGTESTPNASLGRSHIVPQCPSA
jgi:hypothetical protein